MRRLIRLAVALLAVLIAAQPAVAGIAVIETTAPLKDDSNEGVKVVVFAAVQNAVKGAVAMGPSRVTLNGVRVLPQMVIVRVLATDAGADPEASDPEQESSLPSNGPKPSNNELDKGALKIVEGGCHGAL